MDSLTIRKYRKKDINNILSEYVEILNNHILSTKTQDTFMGIGRDADTQNTHDSL